MKTCKKFTDLFETREFPKFMHSVFTPEMDQKHPDAQATTDTVMRSLVCLPKKHFASVKRKLEAAIQEETLAMNEKTRKKFFQKQVSTPPPVSHADSKVIVFNVGCGNVDRALKHSYPDCDCLYYRPIFTNELEAAKALMGWIQKNKFQLVRQSDDSCFKLIKRKDENPIETDEVLKQCLELFVHKQEDLICYDLSDHVYSISFSTISVNPSIHLEICRNDVDEE